MIDQPLGVGLVAGIIFGDVTAGIIIGAALQAIFIGSVNVGGATSADTVAGTVLAVCFVVVSGMEQGVAIPLAVAAAIFANIIYSLVLNVLMSFWAPVIDWAANSGDSKKLFICHFGGAVVMNGLFAIPTFLAVWVGAEPASQLMNMVPQAVLNGFNTASGLLPPWAWRYFCACSGITRLQFISCSASCSSNISTCPWSQLPPSVQ